MREPHGFPRSTEDPLCEEIEIILPDFEIVLAGFYADPLNFQFAPAFRRETRIRIATEFLPADLAAVIAMVDNGQLSLDGLVTNLVSAADAATAYGKAFSDATCLKMVFDWRDAA